MAKKNTVEIILAARDEASNIVDSAFREVQKAAKDTTVTFGSLNSSLKKLGLDSTEIDKLNKEIKSVNPKILDVELENVRNQLKKLGADSTYIDKVTKELKTAEKTTKEVEKTMSSSFTNVSSTASKAFTIIKGVIAGLAAGSAVKIGVDFNANKEQSQIAWETLLKDSDKAKQTILDLQKLGANTPFEFEGLDKAAKLLNMAKFEGNGLKQALVNVGDAVSAVGGGQAELEGVSMALFQMQAKGKASAEEMNQLAERGIPAWDILAKTMGKSVPELMAMSQKGELLAKDVIPALVKGMGEQFGGAMQKQSKTFSGMMSTLKDNLNIFAGQVMEPVFNRMKELLPGVVDYVGKLSDAFANSGLKGILLQIFPPGIAEFIIGTIGMIAEIGQQIADHWGIVGPVVAGVLAGFMAFQTVNGIIKAITIAQAALNAVMAMNPIWMVAIAVGVLIAAGILLYKNWDEISAFLTKTWDSLKTTAISVWEAIKSFFVTTWEEIKSRFKGVWETIGAFYKLYWETIITLITATWETIKTIFAAAFLSIYYLFTGQWDLIGGVWQAAWDKIKGITAAAWESIKANFLAAWTALKTLVSNMWDSIIAFFLAAPGRIGEALEQLKISIMAKWEEIKADALEMGKNIIQGLIDGILSMASAVAQKAREVVQGAIDAAKSALGVHSPSKVFMEIGQFTGEGLALGMEDTLRQIQQASDEMALAAVPEVIQPYGKRQVSRSMATSATATTQKVIYQYTFAPGSIVISAKDLAEIKSIQDFFNRLLQVARAAGVRV